MMIIIIIIIIFIIISLLLLLRNARAFIAITNEFSSTIEFTIHSKF